MVEAAWFGQKDGEVVGTWIEKRVDEKTSNIISG